MPLSARYDSLKLVLYLAGGIALLLVGLHLTATAPVESRDHLVGLVSVVLFGPASAVIFARLFDRRAVLVVDDQGIFDRRVVDRTIPWDAVVGFRERRIRRTWLFYVVLSRPAHEFATSRRKRLLLSIESLFGGDLCLSPHGLDADPHRIRHALHTFLRERAAAPA